MAEVSAEEALASIEAAEFEERLEREREAAQRKQQIVELKRLLTTQRIKDDMLTTIAQHVPLANVPKVRLYPGKKERPKHVWVLMVSDLQHGQRTSLADSGMLYEQSSEVSKLQFEIMWQKVDELARIASKSIEIIEFWIMFLGDIQEGDSMRVSQTTKIDKLAMPQAVEVFDLQSWLIQNALARFPWVRVRIVGGNHDRVSSKPGTAGLGELGMIDTFAWFVGAMLERMHKPAIDSKRLDLVNHESWFGGSIIAGQRVVYEHGACLSGDSEMLTASGWKSHDRLINGELVACWDQATGLLSWQPLKGVSRFQYDGSMVSVKQRGVDQLLTPNHRVYLRPQMYPSSGKVGGRVVEAGELRKTMPLPFAAKWDSYGDYGSRDDGLRLGLFLSEGWLSQGARGKPRIHLAQSVRKNPIISEEIRRLFAHCHVSETTRTSGFTRASEPMVEVYVPAPQREFFDRWAPGKVPNPEILTQWSEAALSGLRDGMLMGDGDSRSQSVFTQRSGPIADMFSAICVRLGHRVSGQHHGQEGITRTKIFGLLGGAGYGKPSDITRWTARLRRDPEMVPYSGTVWCPETPTGAFVARRNGNTFITGNSFRSSTGSYGGISFYSIANAAQGYMRMLDGADIVMMGHFHTPMMLPLRGGHGWQIMNGAFPPSTEFVQSNFKTVGRPQQWLLDLHAEHGLVEARPIYVGTEAMQTPDAFWKMVRERDGVVA